MPAEPILYLSGPEVSRALEGQDIVDAVTSALLAHARGEVALPAEASLGWKHDDQSLRCLSMPAAVAGYAGVKLICSNPANRARGLARASGLIVLLDISTGRPICVLEGARVSCLRTAAVTAIAADLLASSPVERLALLGAGALARCHLDLLGPRLPGLREVRIHDVDEERAAALAAVIEGATICDSAEQAIRGSDLIIPVTTCASGYIRHPWLAPGSLLVNVSLDDPLPEVIARADRIFVDDWGAIVTDGRRLLGRMARAGLVRSRDSDGDGRPIDGELGELLTGARPGRALPDEIIVVNPFGLAIEDVAVAIKVYRQAERLDLGTVLER